MTRTVHRLAGSMRVALCGSTGDPDGVLMMVGRDMPITCDACIHSTLTTPSDTMLQHPTSTQQQV